MPIPPIPVKWMCCGRKNICIPYCFGSFRCCQSKKTSTVGQVIRLPDKPVLFVGNRTFDRSNLCASHLLQDLGGAFGRTWFCELTRRLSHPRQSIAGGQLVYC